MSIAFPSEPFYEEREFPATVSTGTSRAEGLQAFVRFARNEGGRIHGRIMGNEATFRALRDLEKSMDRPHFSIESNLADIYRVRLSSDSMYLTNLTTRGILLGSSEPMVHPVAEFELEDLRIQRFFEVDLGERRVLDFALTGTTGDWHGFFQRTPKLDGSAEIEYQPRVLGLPLPFAASVEISPKFLYGRLRDNVDNAKDVELTSKVTVIKFETDATVAELSDSDYLGTAGSRADDLTVLMSVAARHRVDWFMSTLVSHRHLRSFVRRSVPRSGQQLWSRDYVIQEEKRHEFLEVASRGLRTLRDSNRDISVSIHAALAAYEIPVLERRFMMFFVALERLRESYMADRVENLTVAEKGAFNKLKRKLAELIDGSADLGIGTAEATLIKEKLGELRRRSARAVFQMMFEELQIPWMDAVTPRGNDMPFINTRNCLFHGSGKVPDDRLYKDCASVQALTEAVILKMLGWEDISMCYGQPWS